MTTCTQCPESFEDELNGLTGEQWIRIHTELAHPHGIPRMTALPGGRLVPSIIIEVMEEAGHEVTEANFSTVSEDEIEKV